jgi:DNA polymerase-3 subunit gamma/tau
LTRYAEVVHAGLGEMRGATAPRLLLEVMCARLLLPSASDTESALLQRIERIETRLTMSIPASEVASAAGPSIAEPSKQFARRSQSPQAAEAPEAAAPAVSPPAAAPAPPPAAARPAAPAPAPAPIQTPTPAPKPPPAAPLPDSPPNVTTGQPDATAVRSMWPSVREKVRLLRRPTDVMLDGAVVLGIEGDTLVLSHVSGPLAKRLNEARNVEIIREALKDALGVDWNVRCEAGGAAPPAPADRAAQMAAPQAPDVDEESMLAEVEHEEVAPRRDPEEVALELLQNELGARRIDG